jgi:hypothetical protein
VNRYPGHPQGGRDVGCRPHFWHWYPCTFCMSNTWRPVSVCTWAPMVDLIQVGPTLASKRVEKRLANCYQYCGPLLCRTSHREYLSRNSQHRLLILSFTVDSFPVRSRSPLLLYLLLASATGVFVNVYTSMTRVPNLDLLVA